MSSMQHALLTQNEKNTTIESFFRLPRYFAIFLSLLYEDMLQTLSLLEKNKLPSLSSMPQNMLRGLSRNLFYTSTCKGGQSTRIVLDLFFPSHKTR